MFDDDGRMHEVEDIMCDQVIITEMDFQTKRSATTVSKTKLRLAVAVLADALFPTVVSVYYAYLRNQKTVVENVRRQLLPALLAVLANYISRSLSSVQRGIAYPLNLRIKTSSDVSEQSESESDDIPEKSVECNVLHEPEGPVKADVIFIHGLHGSLRNTWRQGDWRHENHKSRHQSFRKQLSTGDLSINRPGSLKRTVPRSYHAPNKIARKNLCDSINASRDHMKDNSDSTRQYSPCWPQEWIPKDCPGVRVIALNYTTDPYLWRPVWIKKRNRTSMTERSKEMIAHLLKLGVGQHPIIWVGHSKGGLFVKQIVLDSWNQSEESGIGDIYAQTKGILFYSVPHRGSLLADIKLPLLSRSVELLEIERNCPFVLDLHEKFLKLFEDSKFHPEVFSFIETSFTLMSFIYLKIVAFDSADPGVGFVCGVPLDHREICKPAGQDCFLYVELLNIIENVLDS